MRLAALLLTLVALEGCAHHCVTDCGLVVDLAPQECTALRVQEGRTLDAFEHQVGWLRGSTCPLLNQWSIVAHTFVERDKLCGVDGAWVLSGGFCVQGYTHAETRTIELPDFRFQTNAFSHELVHVVQLGSWGDSAVGHCWWAELGIKAALREAGAEEDSARVPSDCAPRSAP